MIFDSRSSDTHTRSMGYLFPFMHVGGGIPCDLTYERFERWREDKSDDIFEV